MAAQELQLHVQVRLGRNLLAASPQFADVPVTEPAAGFPGRRDLERLLASGPVFLPLSLLLFPRFPKASNRTDDPAMTSFPPS
jgi:hypothetical protein